MSLTVTGLATRGPGTYTESFFSRTSHSTTYEPPHVLSCKSARQHRNVFIWCTASRRLALGWRVGNSSSITVSTIYRWITSAVESQCHGYSWQEAESYTLFPVEVQPNDVLTYSVHKTYGTTLSRESQENIVPGDYGLYAIGDSRLYYFFQPAHSFSDMEAVVKANSAALSAKALLTPSIVRQALNRDRQCLFSGAVPSCNSDALIATWIFPPFLGHKLSNDRELEARYYRDPEACDISEFMVVANVISGLKDIVALFWENKLGIDVDDNYRIIVFEGSERLSTLQSHLTLVDGSDRPSDRFLRLHFKECLVVSACRGDVLEDYQDQEIETFMEELGVYDGEIDGSHPKWATPLGVLVNAYLIRQKIAQI